MREFFFLEFFFDNLFVFVFFLFFACEIFVMPYKTKRKKRKEGKKKWLWRGRALFASLIANFFVHEMSNPPRPS